MVLITKAIRTIHIKVRKRTFEFLIVTASEVNDK